MVHCVYTSCYLYAVDRLYKHPEKKVDYVMNNLVKIMSKLLRSAVEISHLQQRALLVATVGDYITNANERINFLSITSGCKDYNLFLTIHRRVLQRFQYPDSAGEGMKFGKLIFRKVIEIVATMSDFKVKMHQNRFRLGLRPRPHMGELTALPHTPSWNKGALLGEGKERGRGRRRREERRREGRDGEER